MREDNIREYVRKLRSFYTDLVIYSSVAILSIVIWMLSGTGYFWPIWVILGCGIAAGFEAFNLGMVPFFTEWFPFLKPEWEEAKYDELLRSDDGASKVKKTSLKVGKAKLEHEEVEDKPQPVKGKQPPNL